MKFKDLPQFSFYIGNTITDGEYDVVATNEGVSVDDELMATYDEDAEIEDASDLMGLIDSAICSIESLSDEDIEELGVVLYNGADFEIKFWWNEKVSH